MTCYLIFTIIALRMEIGFCHLSIVPVYRDSNESSEMVSQLLFGDFIEISEIKKQWAKIKSLFDDETGWIDIKQYVVLSEAESSKMVNNPLEITTDLLQLLVINGKDMIPVVLGSNLPLLQDNTFYLNANEYYFEGQSKIIKALPLASSIIEQAYMYLNAPYLHGGKTPFGIDAAGLTQMVFKLNGIKIPHDVALQANYGNHIHLISDAEPGDLLFFENEQKKITHCGIYIEDSKVMHAYGRVRIDAVDHQGIFDTDTKTYTHSLRLIKRLLS